MNPCPCGFFGDTNANAAAASCRSQRYRDRISGPLLDRIDIHLEVPAIQYRRDVEPGPGELSAAIRERIEAARELPAASARSEQGGSAMPECRPKQLKTHCQLDEAGEG